MGSRDPQDTAGAGLLGIADAVLDIGAQVPRKPDWRAGVMLEFGPHGRSLPPLPALWVTPRRS